MSRWLDPVKLGTVVADRRVLNGRRALPVGGTGGRRFGATGRSCVGEHVGAVRPDRYPVRVKKYGISRATQAL